MALGPNKKRGGGCEEQREAEIEALVTLFLRPSIARQKILLGTLEVPDYLSKCQIIEQQGWTEKQYNEENSIYFLEAEFAVYLEAKSRAQSQQKPAGKQNPPARTPRRRR